MKKTVFYIILCAFAFSTFEINGKLVAGAVDPTIYSFWRFMIGGLCLLPFAIKDHNAREKIEKRRFSDYKYSIIASIILVPVSMYIYQVGICYCSAAVASVMICANGAVAIILGAIIFKEEMSKKIVLYICLVLIGIVCMMSPWNLPEGTTAKGLLLILFAVITFGVYPVFTKLACKKVTYSEHTCISLLLGSILMIPVVEFKGLSIMDGVMDNLLALLYAGFCVTALGYYSLNQIIKYSDVGTSAVAFFLKVIFAPILCFFYLGENISLSSIIGIVVISIGSAIKFSTMKESKQ